jgi:histone-arginine methyltransferase CARM1
MLETFVIARQKFLKPGGRMFPTKAELFLVPFNDQVLADEQSLKSDFWKTTDFFGVDVSCLHQAAMKEKY